MRLVLLFSKKGFWIIYVLLAIPIMFFLPLASLSTLPSIFLSLSQLFALMAIVLYSINFILSTRLRVLENFFGGLSNMYIVHHLVGASAFVFILLHPIFIGLSYAYYSPMLGLSLFVPTLDNLPVLFGIMAFLVTITILVITLFIKIKYSLWKKIHQYMGLGFLLASIHIFLTTSFLDASLFLEVYVYIFIFLALASFCYKTLLGRVFIKKRMFRVVDVRKLSNDVLEVSIMTDDKKPFLYHGGQFVFIRPYANGIPQEDHPFSAVSKPDSLPFVFASKIVGEFTESLKLLKKGVQVSVEGPYGQFGWEFHPSKVQVWVAGGIGITPFMSMAKNLPEQIVVYLYYTIKNSKEAVYLNELKKLSKENPNLKLFLHNSSKQGHLTADIINTSNSHFNKCKFFVCGPKQMMKSLRTQLNSKGIKNTKIFSEEFSLS